MTESISMLLPVGSLADVFMKSHLVSGKMFTILLMASSVYCWTVMTAKGRDLSAALRNGLLFQRQYRDQNGNPLALFLQRLDTPECPLKKIYLNAVQEIGHEMDSKGIDPDRLIAGDHSRLHLNPYQLTAIRNAAERAIADEALRLEEKMGWLATAANTAPLLGLLGTIWGVMETFSAMGEQGNASIAAVAPGISSALMTTFCALIVAIPSAIGYNVLTGKVHTIAVLMDNFADEVMADLQRAYLRE